MDRNLVVQSWWQESEREKEADIPWFMQRTNKALDTGLASLMKAQGTLSRGAWKPGQESEHEGFLHSRELAGGRPGLGGDKKDT